MGGDVCATHVNPSFLSVTQQRRLGNRPACNRRSLTRLSLSTFADRHHLPSRPGPQAAAGPGCAQGARSRLNPLRPQREPSRAVSPVFMLNMEHASMFSHDFPREIDLYGEGRGKRERARHGLSDRRGLRRHATRAGPFRAQANPP